MIEFGSTLQAVETFGEISALSEGLVHVMERTTVGLSSLQFCPVENQEGIYTFREAHMRSTRRSEVSPTLLLKLLEVGIEPITCQPPRPVPYVLLGQAVIYTRSFEPDNSDLDLGPNSV